MEKKKLILMLCVAALTLSFASCGDTDKGSKDNESAASSASETVESGNRSESGPGGLGELDGAVRLRNDR